MAQVDTGYAATSPRLDYQINFLKTGMHYVWILAWGASGTDDSCHAGLDGVETPLSNRMTGWSANYRWANGRYERPEPSQIEITSTGPHVLNIYVREDGLIIDKIVLTTNPNFTLSGSEPGPPESSRGLVLNAFSPVPADGALHQDTWVSLSWSPGQTAASHDVYMGESLADVNDGLAGTFRGNQASSAVFVGLGLPGDPYPSGLVPGTAYYWRIDEVEANGTTKHKGDVWSFSIPPRTAYDPAPADASKFVDTAITLSWTPGLAAKLHRVYFGNSLDDVNNAAVGTPAGTATFTPPGPLELGKTYYWRIDEFDGAATHKGDVWSFTTLGEIPITDPNLVGWWKFEAGQGTRVVDFSGHGNHGTIVPGALGTVQWVEGLFNLALEFLGDNWGHVDLPGGIVTPAKGSVLMWINTTQGNAANDDEGMLWYATAASGNGYTNTDNEMHLNIDDPGEGELDFYLGGGSGITIDGPRVGGTGWTHVAATWDLTDGIRMYVNGVQVGSAAHTGLNTNLAIIRLGRPITTGDGNRYYDGLMDDVRLFNHAISGAAISEIMTKGEDPRRAGALNPADNALVPINLATPLSWSPGEMAAQHDVYFGLDKGAVAGADASDTTGVYRGRQSATSYTPPEVVLGGGPYFWRIDEVNKDGTITAGGIWSFSVTDYLLVDDFESYNEILSGQAGSHLVYETWSDGLTSPTINGGSTIGYPQGASMETGLVYGGRQSAPLAYDNTTAGFSEVTVDPANTAIGRNWTIGSPQTLVLWFHGGPGNAVTERMYVKINSVKVVYPGAAVDIARARWSQWNIDLAALGVNLSNVTPFAIGFERTGAAGGAGTVLIDEIRLYQSAPLIVPPSSEEIWIEAEATASIIAPMQVYDDPTASAGKYISTDESVGDSSSNPPADGIATYTFTVQGGIYKVSGRLKIPGGSNSFWVRIRGATTPAETELHSTGWVRWNDMPDTGNWLWSDVFSNDNVGTDDPTVLFTMPTGTYTMEIARREDGAQLDVIVISKVG